MSVANALEAVFSGAVFFKRIVVSQHIGDHGETVPGKGGRYHWKRICECHPDVNCISKWHEANNFA